MRGRTAKALRRHAAQLRAEGTLVDTKAEYKAWRRAGSPAPLPAARPVTTQPPVTDSWQLTLESIDSRSLARADPDEQDTSVALLDAEAWARLNKGKL